MTVANIPPDMLRKLDHILNMDLDQLNEAYVKKMLRLRKPILNDNQPSLEEIYKLLIPEMLDLAAKRKMQKAN